MKNKSANCSTGHGTGTTPTLELAHRLASLKLKRRLRLHPPRERRTNETEPGTKTFAFPKGWVAARERARPKLEPVE